MSASSSLRSCGNCHRRKVKCDKQIPCERCRKGGVECVQTRYSRTPRWVERLAATSHDSNGDHGTHTPQSATEVLFSKLEAIEKLVHSSKSVPPHHGHAEPGRDLNSGFWGHIDQELGSLREGILQYAGLEQENDTAVARVQRPSMASNGIGTNMASDGMRTENAAAETYAFVLPSVAPSHAAHDLLPLVSQIPFLVEVYAERVHFITGIPHLPSLEALFRRRKTVHPHTYAPSEDALVFAVFYAAIGSMDEQEVMTSFNQSQHDLLQKYRRGVESSLARADFLNQPSYILLEALTVFLTLARQPSRYAYMLTGTAIHMARYLGLHRGALAASNTTPYQAEMHRRLWWNLCALDLRASEDQGTDLTILAGSFTTHLPFNINESDIWPDMEQPPQERPGLTAVTLLRMCSRIARTTQELMATSSTDNIEGRVQRLGLLARHLEQDYFALPEAKEHIAYTAATGTFRVFLCRLTLLAFVPALLSAPAEPVSDALRTKLLVAAIEMLEHHHALCSEPSCQPWKWVYNTQQHWHAIVFLLIELCRSSWSPVIERAWQALQSPSLVSAQASIAIYKTPTVWVPLRRLMARARHHRDSELQRLRTDLAAAEELEKGEDQHALVFSSSTTFPAYFDDEEIRKGWRQTVGLPAITSARYENTVTPTFHAQQPASYISPYGPVRLQQDVGLGLDIHHAGDTANGVDDILDFDWSAWLENARDL